MAGTSASAALPGEGRAPDRVVQPPGTSAPPARLSTYRATASPLAGHRLDPFLLPAPSAPPKVETPAAGAMSGLDQVREAGAASCNPAYIAALEVLRRCDRQDASYLVPREERVFVQDGPAGGAEARGRSMQRSQSWSEPLRLLRGWPATSCKELPWRKKVRLEVGVWPVHLLSPRSQGWRVGGRRT